MIKINTKIQIRIIIFASFFLMLSMIALPLMAVLFFSSRATLENEIGRNLNSDAIMLMEEVDLLMFESMQNFYSWSRLDVIQEVRHGDVDQLSQFMNDVKSGYKESYKSLFYTDADGKVIAASEAGEMGVFHKKADKEVRAEIPDGEVFFEDMQLASLPFNDSNLVIRTPVYDRYRSKNIGHFYGLFNLQQLFQLLDKASNFRSGDRYIVLLNHEGKVIAASASLRKPDYYLSKFFADWKPEKDAEWFVRNGKPITDASVIVGYANSYGYHGYGQLGWSILIFQNIDKAFLPVRSLWVMFGIIIAVTMLLAFMAAHWISGRIANPLIRLTKWVREVRFSEKLTPPDVGGPVEVGELGMAFREVFNELELSREQVIQAAKLAVVGEMSAIMAHEIRTPLGIILTSAQMLQREQMLSAEGKEMSQLILEETARLRKLVTTLLESARPREPHMIRQNVYDLLRHSIQLLASQAENKHLQVELKANGPKLTIICDGELLTQAFLNLLLNAIQNVPIGGKVQVTFTCRVEYVNIEFADNGPGIEAEDFQRLFDPFFTKREGGIGLGLTVTRQIVTAHHGKLSVRSSEWGGACFVLQLPISKG